MITPRQRLLSALNHYVTDRVRIDVGSCGPTAIQEKSYRDLLRLLGIPSGNSLKGQ